MVKKLLILLPFLFLGANYGELYTATWCKYCKIAEKRCNELKEEGYNIKIYVNKRSRVYPTLIIKNEEDEVIETLEGVQTKEKYRKALDGEELDSDT